MTAFTHLICSDPLRGDPSDEFEARNYMLGKLKNGDIIDPCDDPWGQVFGVPCETIDPLFWYSGDPESNYGWINSAACDQRMVVSTGPFTLEENKPITIIVGYTIGQGIDPLNSVTVGKEVSAFVQQFYQSNFDDNILPVEDENNIIVDEFKLYQNYPNPFNPSTKIRFTITVPLNLPQGETFVTLRIFDILGAEVGTLANEELPGGEYEVEFNASSLPSGVYFYQLRAGNFVETKKMVLLK